MRRRSCGRTGKLRYGTEDAARRALLSTMIARAFRKKGGHRRREQRVYRCGFCGGWHLTAQPKRSS